MTIDELMYGVMKPLASYYRARAQIRNSGRQPAWRIEGAKTRERNAREEFAQLIEKYIDTNKEEE